MKDNSSQIELVQFKPGDVLFRENETSYHFYIIQDGQVEVFKQGQGGSKIPLAVVGEGTSIGEFAMIDRLPRSATAVALSKVSAAKVSDAAYQQLFQELPDWAVAVMRALVDRLRQTNEIVRRHGIVSPDVKREIDSVEFDPDSGTQVDTLIEEVPDLGSAGEDQ